MIKISDLQKTYNKKEVLNIPHLEINPGEVVGIVGNNGAGKSTLFKLILDLIAADKGEILIQDINVKESEEWKEFTGTYLDNSFLLDFLNAEEYFQFIGSFTNLDEETIEERIQEFKSFLGVENLDKKKYIRDFSSGNKQKAGIIGALLHHPNLLILDEPFNFLDPTSQERTNALLKAFNKKYNSTILISSHNLEHTLHICTRVLLLENGYIIKDLSGDSTLFYDKIANYFKNNSTYD